ncbi:MAG: ComEC family competence protein [Prevotella sp.]|nr:ComEC family competence protein [Prevotella sp.]
MVFSLTGLATMLFSCLIPENAQYRWRWLFGAGTGLFLVSIGIVSTSLRQQQSEFTFPDRVQAYIGIVTDVPQEKKRATAYRVHLPEEDRLIVCYFQRDSSNADRLQPGDIFSFQGKIQPFRNMGDFDYARYMYNQGFAGSVYVPAHLMELTGEVSPSLKYTALRCRRHIMDFYKSLGFDDVQYNILSALTLGYQDGLSDDIKQGFRTTGTVHVLSISGLHVGAIYLMISFLLGFIHRGTKYYRLKPALVILLLWVYAFITGLPPSVSRASAMLSVFCASEIFARKSFSIHALYIAAFFILLVNPFSLFNIGFQLSFLSVLSILYLLPKVSGLLKTENKYLRKIWQMFILSFVAQLATFPLCLYYFGTFPTYFFIANLLIVPPVTLITYSVGGIALAKLFSLAVPDMSYYLYFLPVRILQALMWFMTGVIRFLENLPLALVEDAKISFADTVLIYAFIVSILVFLVYKKPKGLICALFSIFLFFIVHIRYNLGV